MADTLVAEPISTVEVDVDLEATVPCEVSPECSNEAAFILKSHGSCGCAHTEGCCDRCSEVVKELMRLQDFGLVSLGCNTCGAEPITVTVDEMRPI